MGDDQPKDVPAITIAEASTNSSPTHSSLFSIQSPQGPVYLNVVDLEEIVGGAIEDIRNALDTNPPPDALQGESPASRRPVSAVASHLQASPAAIPAGTSQEAPAAPNNSVPSGVYTGDRRQSVSSPDVTTKDWGAEKVAAAIKMVETPGVWQAVKVKPKDPLFVYRKIQDEAGVMPMFKVTSALKDVPTWAAHQRMAALRWPDWFLNCQLLEYIAHYDGYPLLKCRFVSRWVAPRDLLLFMIDVKKNGDEYQMLWTSDGTEKYNHLLEVPANHLQAHCQCLFLRIRPMGGDKSSTEADALMQIDLKGSVPLWLVNNCGWMASLKFLNFVKASFYEKTGGGWFGIGSKRRPSLPQAVQEIEVSPGASVMSVERKTSQMATQGERAEKRRLTRELSKERPALKIG